MEVNGRRSCVTRKRKISLKIFLISGLNVFFQPTEFESMLHRLAGIQGESTPSLSPCVVPSLVEGGLTDLP